MSLETLQVSRSRNPTLLLSGRSTANHSSSLSAKTVPQANNEWEHPQERVEGGGRRDLERPRQRWKDKRL